MLLIILPLAKKGKEVKQKVIEQVVDLAKQIEDENTQAFVITGILVSSDKFIDRDYAKSVRRYLSMTKVFQILEEEKQEAINIARKNERRETRLEMIESFIKAGTDTLTLMQATGLTKEEILEEEKQEAINLAEKKAANNMIENFIKAGADTLMIMQATGLTKEEIEEIKKNMMVAK